MAEERHFANVFAGMFAVATLVLAVLPIVTETPVETTTYYAVAAFWFALLTVGTWRFGRGLRGR